MDKNAWRIRVLYFIPKFEQKALALRRNCWGSTHRTAFYLPRCKFWRILFVRKWNFVILLGGSAKKKFINCVKKVSSLLKTALDLCRSLFSTFSSNVLWILKVSDFERNFFGLIAKTFSYRSRNLLEQKCFSEKNRICDFLCTLGKKFSHIGQELFRQCSRLYLVRVQDKTSGGNFIGKKWFSIFSLTLSDKISDF